MDIQTPDAVIPAIGSIVFCGTVLYDGYKRAKLREQERRDNIIAALHRVWGRTADGPTPEEQEGFYSERQIDFFNSKLRERGEKRTYPFEPI